MVRQRAFSKRIVELMTRYTNQQLTSAEVIAELAREVAVEGNRGARFEPPLSEGELAFYDAVALNEFAVQEQGEGVLADIPPHWAIGTFPADGPDGLVRGVYSLFEFTSDWTRAWWQTLVWKHLHSWTVARSVSQQPREPAQLSGLRAKSRDQAEPSKRREGASVRPCCANRARWSPRGRVRPGVV